MAFDANGFRQAAIKAGYKQADVEKVIQQKAQKEAQLNLAKQGVLDPAKLAETDPILAQQAIQQGAIPAVSATETKRKNSANEVINFINNLEKSYSDAGGGTYGVGPGARIKGALESLKGNVGLNESASGYNDTKEGFAATLKSLTGDTGVLTDQDFERLSKLLPGLGSTKKESIDKFNLLRDQVGAKFGSDKTSTTFQPKKENDRGALASILDIPLGPAVDLGEKAQKDLNRQLETGKYKTIKDLLFPKTSEDVGLLQDVAPAGIATGNTLLAAEGLAGGVKNLMKKITGSGASSVAAREAAAQGVKVNTKKLIEAGDDFVKNIDPSAKKTWETLRPSIKEETDLPELLKKITNWGDKSFTKSGDKRAITEGLLKAHLYGTGRNIVREQAPEVAKLTADIAKNISREEFTKKLPSIAATGLAGGIGSGVAGYGLYKALGRQK